MNGTRIAFLSDIHANLPALRAALEAARAAGANRIIVAGDLIGDGPFPAETVDLVRNQSAEVILGNVDRAVTRLGRRKRKKVQKRLEKGGKKSRNRAWTLLALADGDNAWLRELPAELTLEVNGARVLVVHGSPLGDDDNIYPSLTSEALSGKLGRYAESPPQVLVSGHTHVPFVRKVDGTLVVNCGSVGRPADGDPRGSFAIVDIQPNQTPTGEIVRFSYPLEELEQAIAERGVPGIDFEEYQRAVKN
jgi:putative phosphoesterase